MRDWIGVRNDVSDVGGEALQVAESVSFDVSGEIRRRAGLTKESVGGGIYMAHIDSQIAGSSLVTVRGDGTIHAVAVS